MPVKRLSPNPSAARARQQGGGFTLVELLVLAGLILLLALIQFTRKAGVRVGVRSAIARMCGAASVTTGGAPATCASGYGPTAARTAA